MEEKNVIIATIVTTKVVTVATPQVEANTAPPLEAIQVVVPDTALQAAMDTGTVTTVVITVPIKATALVKAATEAHDQGATITRTKATRTKATKTKATKTKATKTKVTKAHSKTTKAHSNTTKAQTKVTKAQCKAIKAKAKTTKARIKATKAKIKVASVPLAQDNSKTSVLRAAETTETTKDKEVRATKAPARVDHRLQTVKVAKTTTGQSKRQTRIATPALGMKKPWEPTLITLLRSRTICNKEGSIRKTSHRLCNGAHRVRARK